MADPFLSVLQRTKAQYMPYCTLMLVSLSGMTLFISRRGFDNRVRSV